MSPWIPAARGAQANTWAPTSTSAPSGSYPGSSVYPSGTLYPGGTGTAPDPTGDATLAATSLISVDGYGTSVSSTTLTSASSISSDGYASALGTASLSSSSSMTGSTVVAATANLVQSSTSTSVVSEIFNPACVSASKSFGTSTVNAPANISAGNLLVAVVYGASSGTSITPPTGWTAVLGQKDTLNAGIWWYLWKVATGSEPSTYTFTVANLSVAYQANVIVQFSAADTTNPVFDLTSTSISTATSTFTFPSTTPTANGAELAIACGYKGLAVSYRDPYLTNFANVASASNVGLDVSEFVVSAKTGTALPSGTKISFPSSQIGFAATLTVKAAASSVLGSTALSSVSSMTSASSDASASLSSTSSLTATASLYTPATQSGDATLLNTSTVTASAFVEVLGFSALSNTSSLNDNPANASLVSSTSLSVSGSVINNSQASADLSCPSTLTGTATVTTSSVTGMVSSASLTATQNVTAVAVASLTSAAQLLATPGVSRNAASTLSNNSRLVAAASAVIGIADLSVIPMLTAGPVITVKGAAALTQAATIATTATRGVNAVSSMSQLSSATIVGTKVKLGTASLTSNSSLNSGGVTTRFGAANLVAATADSILADTGAFADLSVSSAMVARATYYVVHSTIAISVVTDAGTVNIPSGKSISGVSATVSVPAMLGDVSFGSTPPVPGSDTANVLVFTSGGTVAFGSYSNGDFFDSPILMNESTGTANIDPGSATLESSEPATGYTGSIWLYLKPSTPGYLTVRGDTTTVSYNIELFQGNSLAGLNLINSTNFTSGGTTLPELFETVAGGVDYYVRVTSSTVGVINLDWSFDARRPQLVFQLTSPLLGANSAGVLDTTPGSLNASIIGADPNEKISFSFLNGALISTYTADDTGVLNNVSLDIPETAAGQYNITATALNSGRTDVQVMTITNSPTAQPTLPPADTIISTIPAASVNKWVFVNPPTGETYTLPINPNRMTSPHAPRNVFSEMTTAPDGQMIMWEGARRCLPWTIEGYILDQAHYEKMEQFLALNNRIIIVDHRMRAWICSVEAFEPQKIGYETNPYWAKYSLTAFIYGGGQKVTTA